MCNNIKRRYDDFSVSNNATAAQIQFIKELDAKLGYDSGERDFTTMSKFAASALITALKEELEG